MHCGWWCSRRDRGFLAYLAAQAPNTTCVLALAPAANHSGYSTFLGDSADYNQTTDAAMYDSSGTVWSAWAGEACSASQAAICEGLAAFMYTCPSVSTGSAGEVLGMQRRRQQQRQPAAGRGPRDAWPRPGPVGHAG